MDEQPSWKGLEKEFKGLEKQKAHLAQREKASQLVASSILDGVVKS